jgi:chromosome segregation ATPase
VLWLLSPAVAGAEAPSDPAARVAEIAAQPDAKVVAEPLESARDAAQRARGAREAGDEPHAHMIDEIARLWTRVAEHILRASRLEAEAKEIAREAQRVERQVERARALLTETQSRHGQAMAELERLGGKAGEIGGGVLATPPPVTAPAPPPVKSPAPTPTPETAPQ